MGRLFFLFLAITFLLAACVPVSQPQVTVTPQAAATLPLPTETPIPTPALSPQFLALQDQIAQSDLYTLNADGQIEMQTPEGMTVIPGILIDPNGKMTVTVDGETFEADPATIKTNGQILFFQDENGKTWILDGENLSKAIELVNDVFDPEQLPEGDWEYFSSPQFLKDLQNADAAGLIPHPNPETVIYIEPGQIRPQFNIQNNKFFEKYGVSPIYELGYKSQYAKEENRPWTYVGGWQTEIGGIPSVFFVLRIENSDGTAGFQGFFIPTEFLIATSTNEDDGLRKETTVNSRSYQPGIFVDPVKVNQRATKYQLEFALGDLYDDFSNFDEAEVLYLEWVETGLFDNTLPDGNELLPILPASASLI